MKTTDKLIRINEGIYNIYNKYKPIDESKPTLLLMLQRLLLFNNDKWNSGIFKINYREFANNNLEIDNKLDIIRKKSLDTWNAEFSAYKKRMSLLASDLLKVGIDNTIINLGTIKEKYLKLKVSYSDIFYHKFIEGKSEKIIFTHLYHHLSKALKSRDNDIDLPIESFFVNISRKDLIDGKFKYEHIIDSSISNINAYAELKQTLELKQNNKARELKRNRLNGLGNRIRQCFECGIYFEGELFELKDDYCFMFQLINPLDICDDCLDKKWDVINRELLQKYKKDKAKYDRMQNKKKIKCYYCKGKGNIKGNNCLLCEGKGSFFYIKNRFKSYNVSKHVKCTTQ